MSTKAHPRLVGAFVLGATALLLGAVLILGSGSLFRRADRFTVFFPGSVKGLGKGSQVTFRGIKIGEVQSVHGIWTGRPDEPIQIEVQFELFESVVDFAKGVPQPYATTTPAQLARALVGLGIRARLMSQSLLTGQKYIELDFRSRRTRPVRRARVTTPRAADDAHFPRKARGQGRGDRGPAYRTCPSRRCSTISEARFAACASSSRRPT